MIDGNGGADTGLMGAGDDVRLDPGDGGDVVEGQDGADTMLFNGAGGGERSTCRQTATVSGSSALGRITMDTAGVERVDFNALGGASLATVNDLSGTDVSDVRLGSPARRRRRQPDRPRVVGEPAGQRKDTINVHGDAAIVTVSGLQALVAIQHRSRPTSSASTASPAMTRSTPPG